MRCVGVRVSNETLRQRTLSREDKWDAKMSIVLFVCLIAVNLSASLQVHLTFAVR